MTQTKWPPENPGRFNINLSLTLTAAKHIVILELPKTWADFVQAMDRIHRYGQVASEVKITVFVLPEAGDDFMLGQLQAWKDLSDAVLDGRRDEIPWHWSHVDPPKHLLLVDDRTKLQKLEELAANEGATRSERIVAKKMADKLRATKPDFKMVEGRGDREPTDLDLERLERTLAKDAVRRAAKLRKDREEFKRAMKKRKDMRPNPKQEKRREPVAPEQVKPAKHQRIKQERLDPLERLEAKLRDDWLADHPGKTMLDEARAGTCSDTTDAWGKWYCKRYNGRDPLDC